MLKIRAIMILSILPWQALSSCKINNKQSVIISENFFKTQANTTEESFALDQVNDNRINKKESSYFIWKQNKSYFFTNRITYSSGKYSREMISNAHLICSINEMTYILNKNKNNIASVILIKNPRSEGFLDRQNDLLVSRATYIDFTFYFIIESIRSNVKFEILDSWNYSSFAKKKIK